jgi:hypothetical protein
MSRSPTTGELRPGGNAATQVTPQALASSHVFFEPRPGYLFRPGPALVGSNLAADFDTPSSAGRNPPAGASINYYSAPAATTPVALTILDPAGTAIRTLEGSRTPGVNRVWCVVGSLRRDAARGIARAALRPDESADPARAGRRLHRQAVRRGEGLPDEAHASKGPELGLAVGRTTIGGLRGHQ